MLRNPWHSGLVLWIYGSHRAQDGLHPSVLQPVAWLYRDWTPVTDVNMTVMTIRKECLFICCEEKIALNIAIQSAVCVQASVTNCCSFKNLSYNFVIFRQYINSEICLRGPRMSSFFTSIVLELGVLLVPLLLLREASGGAERIPRQA